MIDADTMVLGLGCRLDPHLPERSLCGRDLPRADVLYCRSSSASPLVFSFHFDFLPLLLDVLTSHWLL
jgi:hypothetical protein